MAEIVIEGWLAIAEVVDLVRVAKATAITTVTAGAEFMIVSQIFCRLLCRRIQSILDT